MPRGHTATPPVIDISAAVRCRKAGRRLGDDVEARQVVQEVATACQDWGFFQCRGHGVPAASIERFDAACRAFFAMPRDDKAAVKRTERNSRGWFDDELTKQTKDWKEGLDVGQPGASEVDGFNQWPADSACPGFQPHVTEYYEACRDLSVTLMHVCAVGLGLEDEFFDRDMSAHTSYLRMNMYPVCKKVVGENWGLDEPGDEGFLGINKHTDAGALTVLRQYHTEPASLQVFRYGVWQRVVPVKGAFTINIGDMMQVWSNGHYIAPIHRVLANTERIRYSAPFFYNPNYDADVAPVPTTGVPRFAPLNWGEFRRRRFEGDFKDAGKEVQISDWAIEPPPPSRL